MADLTDIQSAQAVKIAGADPSTGLEDNFAEVTTAGGVHTNLRNSAGVESGTAGQPLRTDPTGTTTQPVSGAVTANQGGTWTVQPGNTANTTPWLVNLSSVNNLEPQSSGTLTAAGTALSVNTQGMASITFNLTGTWVATLTIEASTDGTNFFTVNGVLRSGDTVASTITSNGAVTIACGGHNAVRLRCTAYTSGTIAIAYRAGIGENIRPAPAATGAATAANQTTEITALQLLDNIVGTVAAGTAATGSALIGGVFNTTLPTMTSGQGVALQTDANARLITISTPVDGTKATYCASIIGLAAAATATDIFTITGSATKTIRVTRIKATATQTTGLQQNIVLLKRSTANTGGTSTTPTVVPIDSTNAAGTAVVRAYTVNPTTGTLVGNIRAEKILVPAAGTLVANPGALWDFGARPAQAVVLRGVAEVLAVNLNSTTMTGNNWNIDIEWSEE